MKRISILLLACTIHLSGFSQSNKSDSIEKVLNFQKDSILRSLKQKRDSSYNAEAHKDSVKTEKRFKDLLKQGKVKAIAIFPVIKAGDFSGVIPVKNPTEIPDPNIEYKLLMELTDINPDSKSKEINTGLNEVVRRINLHVASGIPLKKIIPVIVVHGGALFAFTNNDYYKKKYKTDNPNLKVLSELKNIGAKFIACGQAMAFLGLNAEDMMPDVKISLTAQTVLSSYQLKGYVLYKIVNN